jgi:serine/threonine protein kinase
MTNLVGQTFDRYHILEQLGEGGMAVVYKAYDSHLDRAVAVKVILPGFEQSENFLKRFEREAQALARLVHPNIVRVLDYGHQQGLPYLVMEYLPGGTLKQKTGRPMPWQEAAHLLAPIARALAYAHQVGILHRDIKPSNILITHSGEPMLSDFGLAKLLQVQDGVDLTGSTGVIGTPAYMAPEQMVGGKVDRRVDIYALGIVFYELVTGRTPYRADTPAAIMVKVVTEPLPRPTSFMADLPEMVEFAILKALEKDPENRFQNMEDFALALEGFAAGRIPASPESASAPTSVPAPVIEPTPFPAPTASTIEPTPAPAPTPPPSSAAPASQSTVPAEAVMPENEPASTEAGASLPQEPAEAAEASTRPEASAAPKKKWPAWAIGLASLIGLLLVGGIAAGIYFLGGFGGNKNEPIPSPTAQINTPVFNPPPAFTPAPPALARSIQPYQPQEGDHYPVLQRFVSGWAAALEPGLRNWEVRLRANQAVLIAPGWCTSTVDLLNQNFPHIHFLVEADGLPVDTNTLQLVEEQNPEGACRQFMGLIRNWSEGLHVIKMTMQLDAPINDGKNELPAGDYVNFFNVTAIPPTPLNLSIVVLPYDPKAGENYPTLRSLTPGYKMLPDPGVSDWSLTVEAGQPAVLTQGWCSKTAKILGENFKHVKFTYELDGVPMDMGRFNVMDEQNAYGACRNIYGVIHYWPEGVHIIQATMHVDSDLNDGSTIIPAGDYVDIFDVLVLPPK